MKMSIFRPVLIVAVFSFLLASCGGASETTSGNEGLMTDDQTYHEAEILSDIADAPVNNNVNYDEMFEGIETEEYEVLALAAMNENLSIFSNLMELSVMDFQMEFAGEPVTVLIPTNAAFKEMPEERFEYLVDPDNRVILGKFLMRFILPTKVPLARFNTTQIIETASEEEITISTGVSNLVYIGGAQIVKGDIPAANGLIHIVDDIIEPTSDVIAD